MKWIFCLLFIVFGLLKCNLKSTEKTQEKQNDNIFLKDKTQYDQTFIEGLKNYNEPIKQIGNYIINGNDTTNFPTDLIINKQIIFSGMKANQKYILTVTRTNLTNLNYNFSLLDKENKFIFNKTGKAILGSMFFLAPEGDEDKEMNEGYGSYEYSDKSDKCWFVIRIGIGKDPNGRNRAKIIFESNKKGDPRINLDNGPTLRTN